MASLKDARKRLADLFSQTKPVNVLQSAAKVFSPNLGALSNAARAVKQAPAAWQEVKQVPVIGPRLAGLEAGNKAQSNLDQALRVRLQSKGVNPTMGIAMPDIKNKGNYVARASVKPFSLQSTKVPLNKDEVDYLLRQQLDAIGGIATPPTPGKIKTAASKADDVAKGVDPKLKPLYEEARKYKSAEEFADAQGALFRGEGTDVGMGLNIRGKGLYTGTKDVAKRYSKDGKLKAYKLSDDAKVLDANSTEYKRLRDKSYDARPKSGNWRADDKVREEALAKLIREAGYDALKAGDETVIFNIKKATDLTDLYNQAHKSNITYSTAQAVGNVADDVAKGAKSTLKVKPSTNVGKLKNSGIDTFTDLSKEIKFISGRKTTQADVETVLGINKDKIDDYVKGTKTGYGKIPTMLRGIEADTSKMVGAMLESKNPVIRGVGNSLRGFGSGLGKSSEDVARSLEFKGMQDYALELQDRVMRYSHEVLNKDPKSLARVYAHLSPEDSGKLIKFNELTPDEKEVANVYRVVSDFINQQNFDNGFISEANYLKNKGGKYMPRLLDVFEYPEEISKFIKKTGIKIDDAPYLKKGELTQFKKEHLIKDPGYLLGKRLRQTMFNDSVVKMSNALKNTPHVSDEAREGFVKLSDNKLYGALSGKYIKKNIYEDMVGFYSTHDGAQKFLDLMDKYDNNVVRKNFKKLMTVYNPGTHMGNMTSNPIFAWMNGIAPQKYVKQVPFALKQEKTKGALYRHLQKSGIVGTDLMKKDLADLSASVMSQVDDPTILKKIKGVDQQLINAYSKTDDVAKIAALKHWLDAGYTLEAATERVMRGFQNYNLVGYLYNIGAKTPLLGNPFVRFKGDWLRLVKNSMIDNPFHIASGLIAWQLFTTGMSKLSGETDEDRKTREGRLGAARFPGTDISTSVQTPFGELNASRLLGSVAMNDIGGKNLTGDLSDYSPFLIPQKSDKTGGLYNVSGDPVAGPLLSMAFDTDFRGKSISDPDSYAPGSSTLTNQEQNTNRAKFLARSYTPPVGNAVKDLADATAGKENFYGKEMSPGQAFLRLFPGVKVEKFGPEEAQAQRDREAGFADSKADALNRKIGTIENQLARGEITPEQAMSRIEALSDQRGTALEEAGYGEVRKDGGKYKVLINDEIKTINVGRVTSLPESNNFEKSIKRAKAFELSDDIITLLPQSQQQEALNELGISPSEAKYHYIAKQTNDAKVSYLQDQMPRYTDRNQLIGALVQGRAEINNKIFSTGTLLDDLQDLGYITKDEAKYIESIKSINGNLVSKRSGGKKAKAPTLKIKLPKRTKALKTATLKTIKPIKLQNIKKTKAPK